MKRSLLYTAPLAFGLAAASLQLAPTLQAQSQSPAECPTRSAEVADICRQSYKDEKWAVSRC